MTSPSETDDVPRSVRHLSHEAQISHRGIPESAAMLDAIRQGGGDDPVARVALGLAIQEVDEEQLVALMVDRVLDGRQLHRHLADLLDTDHMRRRDLVEWSEMFA